VSERTIPETKNRVNTITKACTVFHRDGKCRKRWRVACSNSTNGITPTATRFLLAQSNWENHSVRFTTPQNIRSVCKTDGDDRTLDRNKLGGDQRYFIAHMGRFRKKKKWEREWV